MKIKEIIEEAGYEPVSFEGFGAFSKGCLSVDAGPNLMAFVADLIVACDGDDMVDCLSKPLRDARIHGSVVYFPDISFND